MKNFTELANQRHSVRKYSDKQVEQEKIDAIIEACRVAPSANNSQPWKLIFVTDPELKNKVAEATYSGAVKFNRFSTYAPVICVIVAEKPKVITQVSKIIKKIELPLIDIGILASHFCHTAADLGLGTCMLGWYDEQKVKSLLSIPEKRRIGLLITLGYESPDAKIKQKIRKTTDEIVSYNKY